MTDHFDHVESDHCLEHLPNPFAVMKEVHRIAKNGATVIIRVPHFSRGFTHAEHKEVMRGKLPDNIIDRPKKGFGIPLSDWLRNELRPLCEELLAPARITREGLFRSATIERLKQEHFSKRANHRKLLWALMVFELWHSGQGRDIT